jgi:hypothetical protein
MENYGTQLYPLEKHWAGKAPYLKKFLEVLYSHVTRETNTLFLHVEVQLVKLKPLHPEWGLR